MSEQLYKVCPYCREKIMAKAIKCKHCKSFVAEAESSGEPGMRKNRSANDEPVVRVYASQSNRKPRSRLLVLGIVLMLVVIIAMGVHRVLMLQQVDQAIQEMDSFGQEYELPEGWEEGFEEEHLEQEAEILMEEEVHLFTAVEKGNIDEIYSLLEKGANVNAREEMIAETPLHLAADYGYTEVVKLLLDHGADVNARSQGDWTPLHWATSSGNIEVAKILLDHGADVNARNKDGYTPLYWGNLVKKWVHAFASGGDIEGDIFVSYNAPLIIRGIDFADTQGIEEVAELLRQHGGVE